MKYVVEGEIGLPRKRVIELFLDADNLPEWQDGLISHQALKGEPGQDGATARRVHRMGRRRVEMIETVEVNELPDRLSVIYQAQSAWNRVIYHFRENGSTATRWAMECEFRCRGVLRVMAFLMPGMFRRTTEKEMQSFRAFAESRGA